MSIEEKAKRYDEAIEKAKIWHIDCQIDFKKSLELLFPELAESEDERIRKALVELVHAYTGDSLWVDYNVHKEDAIAWLEKQGRLMKALQISNSRIAELVEEKYNLEEKLKKQGEQKPYASETMNEKGDFDSCFTKMMEKEQKPAECTEEDESNIHDIKYLIYENCSAEDASRLIEWLYRVQPQHKQEWSEEDENMLQSIIDEYKSMLTEKRNWLKSIKERYTWEPSDEQMNTLEYYIHTLICNEHKEILFGLYTDLKKLREE